MLCAIVNHNHCSASGGSVVDTYIELLYLSYRYATSKACVEKENVLEISAAVGVYISHT